MTNKKAELYKIGPDASASKRRKSELARAL